MILKNRIHIFAPPGRLWPLISDPVCALAWNPHLKTVIPVTLGERKAGSLYRIRYHLFRGESNYAAELMEFEEPMRCVLHMKGGNLPGRGYLQEIYDVSITEQGSMLTQTILIADAGLLFPSSLNIRLKNLIGNGSSRRYLRKLKGLAESSCADPASPVSDTPV